MRVLYISHLLERSGWGQASRDILRAMDLAGIDVVPRVVTANNPTHEPDARTQELLCRSSKNCDVVIQHLLPHLYQYSGHFKKNIGLYYAETGNLNYTPYFSYLNMMDELWVPSEMMRQQALDSGVITPVYLVPHPFREVQTQKHDKLDIQECLEGDYIFYYIGEATRRKNLSALLRAFHTEFSFNEPVQLVIKANRAGMSNESCASLVNEFASAAKEHSKLYYNVQKYKQEIIITSDMTDDDILKLHQTGDCLVVPSSGEAINLPAMDALQFGNKVVASAFTGAVEFLQQPSNNAYLVNAQPKNCYGMTEGFQDMYSAREECYEIDELDLMQQMRTAYNSGKVKNKENLHPNLLDVGLMIKSHLNGTY